MDLALKYLEPYQFIFQLVLQFPQNLPLHGYSKLFYLLPKHFNFFFTNRKAFVPIKVVLQDSLTTSIKPDDVFFNRTGLERIGSLGWT